MLPLSSGPMLNWHQRGDRDWEFLCCALQSHALCVCVFCLEDSVWGWEEASSQLQCDICFSLHLSETHTVRARLMHVCMHVCMFVCASLFMLEVHRSNSWSWLSVLSTRAPGPSTGPWGGRPPCSAYVETNTHMHEHTNTHETAYSTCTHTSRCTGVAAVTYCAGIIGAADVIPQCHQAAAWIYRSLSASPINFCFNEKSETL